MSYDPSRIVHYLIKETVEGTTPTTGSAYKFAATPGTGPTYAEETVTSTALFDKRQSGGAYTVGGEVGGSFDFELRRSPAMDMVLAGALSGVWVGNSLTAGETDTPYTILKTTGDGSGAMQAFRGCQFTEVSLTSENRAIVTGSSPIIGMGITLPEDVELDDIDLMEDALVAPATSLDITATVGVLPGLKVRSATMTVTHEREVMGALGPDVNVGVGTSGSRVVTMALEFYRRDFMPETALANNAETSVTVNLGTGARGYTVSMPVCTGSWPEESADGAALVVTVTFTAKVNVAGDITISKPA